MTEDTSDVTLKVCLGKEFRGGSLFFRSITAGERFNLIVWCGSSRFAAEPDPTSCPAWCGNRGHA